MLILIFFFYFNKFLIRQEVLKTYKQLLKSINRVDDKSYRYYLIDWLRNDLKYYADEFMSDAAFAKHGLFNQTAVHHIMQQFFKGDRNYNSLFWYLLMFQLWYKKWMGS